MEHIKKNFAKLNLTKNLGLKLLSLVIAIFVWLVVVNISDPETTKIFREVPVIIQNADFLTNEGMVYEVVDNTDVVDITVRAKRSVLRKIQTEDFMVTADLKELVYMQSVRIAVQCEKYEEKIEEYACSHDTVLIEVEKQGAKTFKVELETEGTPAEGYTIGKYWLEPEELTVSGPNSIVKKIDKAVLRINVESMKNDVGAVVAPVLYDEHGEEIDASRLVLSNESWNVVVPIWETKSVAIQVNVTGEPATGYHLGEVTCYPTALTVTGKKSVLENLSQIEIPEEVISVAGASENVELTVDIEQYLPEGIYLADKDVSNVKIVAEVQKQITRKYTLGISEIAHRNPPEDLKVTYGEVAQFDIELRGTKEDLDQVQFADIKCTVDLAGLVAGMHQVPLDIVVSGNAKVVGNPMITVYLTEKVLR